MTDLEMTEFCAEAMGLDLCEQHSHDWPYYFDSSIGEYGKDVRYDPLHNDAQAMALEDWLIERGTLTQTATSLQFQTSTFFHSLGHDGTAAHRRLFLVQCVAKMQVAKAAASAGNVP